MPCDAPLAAEISSKYRILICRNTSISGNYLIGLYDFNALFSHALIRIGYYYQGCGLVSVIHVFLIGIDCFMISCNFVNISIY